MTKRVKSKERIKLRRGPTMLRELARLRHEHSETPHIATKYNDNNILRNQTAFAGSGKKTLMIVSTFERLLSNRPFQG